MDRHNWFLNREVTITLRGWSKRTYSHVQMFGLSHYGYVFWSRLMDRKWTCTKGEHIKKSQVKQRKIINTLQHIRSMLTNKANVDRAMQTLCAIFKTTCRLIIDWCFVHEIDLQHFLFSYIISYTIPYILILKHYNVFS